MRKFLSIIVSFFFIIQSLLFVVPVVKNVRAEVGDVIDTVSCGSYAGACCLRKVEASLGENFPNIPLPFPLDYVNDAVEFIYDRAGRPILNTIYQTINGFIFETIFNNSIRENEPYCFEGDPQTLNGACTCIDNEVQNLSKLCAPIRDRREVNQCLNCVRDAKGVWTGIGCLNTDMGALVREKIGGTFVGIGGAIALLCIMYAAFILQTSRGNPERIKKAKEMLRACITGLLLIIFSVLILKIIGVDILRIPGFGDGPNLNATPAQKPFPVINQLPPTP